MAIQFLHEHGIAHLDIKPQNLAFDEEGGVVLLDFDCAKYCDSETILHKRRGTEGFVPSSFWNEERSFKAFELDEYGYKKTIAWLSELAEKNR